MRIIFVYVILKYWSHWRTKKGLVDNLANRHHQQLFSRQPVFNLVVVVWYAGHTYSKGMDQPGKVANPARGQLNRQINISLSAFAPKNLVSRDGFSRPVPRQPAHSPYTSWNWCLLAGFLPISVFDNENNRKSHENTQWLSRLTQQDAHTRTTPTKKNERKIPQQRSCVVVLAAVLTQLQSSSEIWRPGIVWAQLSSSRKAMPQLLMSWSDLLRYHGLLALTYDLLYK